MTISELINLLQVEGIKNGFDQEVILSKDSEGNGYSPLSDFSYGVYYPETTFSGEFYPHDWNWEDCGFDSQEDYDDFLRGHDSVKAIILSPIN